MRSENREKEMAEFAASGAFFLLAPRWRAYCLLVAPTYLHSSSIPVFFSFAGSALEKLLFFLLVAFFVTSHKRAGWWWRGRGEKLEQNKQEAAR
jgi:hypothetical protein